MAGWKSGLWPVSGSSCLGHSLYYGSKRNKTLKKKDRLVPVSGTPEVSVNLPTQVLSHLFRACDEPGLGQNLLVERVAHDCLLQDCA